MIVAIDGGHRDPAAVEADRADRQHDRAAALTEKADRHTTTALAAHKKARELGDQIPFGQPILVGHHSENRMRRHANRIHQAMDTAVAAAEKATDTQRRAQVAANGTDARYHPVTVANRIQRLTADWGPGHPAPARAHPHHGASRVLCRSQTVLLCGVRAA